MHIWYSIASDSILFMCYMQFWLILPARLVQVARLQNFMEIAWCSVLFHMKNKQEKY